MGICMPAEIRKELHQIEAIYSKTCELKRVKRVLVVGTAQSGKTELIHQAISTKGSLKVNDTMHEEYCQFEYDMGPFIVTEHADSAHSLSRWKYKHEVQSWQNALSYHPPTSSSFANPQHPKNSNSSKSTSLSSTARSLFDYKLLLTGFCRKYLVTPHQQNMYKATLALTGIGIDNVQISELIMQYMTKPAISCIKDEIIDDNVVEFWELPAVDRSFWSYCCQQIVAVVYVVDVSCFNDFYYDAATYLKTENKLSRQLREFAQMVQEYSRMQQVHGGQVAFHVFFNKIDVLKQKLSKGISIKSCPALQAFDGDEYDYKQCIGHLKHVFDAANQSQGNDRLLYMAESCAIGRGDVNALNLLGTISGDMNADHIRTMWRKFGENLNYHWNELDFEHFANADFA